MAEQAVKAVAAGTAEDSEQRDTNAPREQFEIEDPTTTNPEIDNIQLSGPKFAIVILATALCLVITGLDNSILATAVPTITNEFKTVADIGWYASAIRLTSCSFLFFKLYTMVSIKRVLLVSLLIFEVGLLICTVAPTSKVLVLGRAVAGLGFSGLSPGLFTLVTIIVPLRQRAIYGGFGAAIEEMASLCGPILGGVLTDKFSWRACFGINLPLGAIALVIMAFFFPAIPRPQEESLSTKEIIQKLDILGTLIFIPSITCLLLALQWGGQTYGWNDPRIITLLVVFLVSIGVFGFIQYRSEENATIPLRILKQRSILSGAWFNCCCNGSMAVIDYYLPIYFQSVKGYTATKSGYLSIPQVVGLAIGFLFAGTATTMMGYYTPMMLSATVIASVSSGLLTTLTVDTSLVKPLCYQALLGFGVGLGVQGPQVAAQTVLAIKDVSIGLGIILFSQSIGPAVFVAVAQTVFQARLKTELVQQVPGLNTTGFEDMGLMDIQQHIGTAKLKQVLFGFDQSVIQTLYLPVALTCLTLLGSASMEWRSVKKKQS